MEGDSEKKPTKKHRIKVREGVRQRVGDRMITVRHGRGNRYSVAVEEVEPPTNDVDSAPPRGA